RPHPAPDPGSTRHLNVAPPAGGTLSAGQARAIWPAPPGRLNYAPAQFPESNAVPGSHLNALVCHPASPANGIVALTVAADYSANGLALSFRLTGDPQDILIPPPLPATASDGLWQH